MLKLNIDYLVDFLTSIFRASSQGRPKRFILCARNNISPSHPAAIHTVKFHQSWLSELRFYTCVLSVSVGQNRHPERGVKGKFGGHHSVATCLDQNVWYPPNTAHQVF